MERYKSFFNETTGVPYVVDMQQLKFGNYKIVAHLRFPYGIHYEDGVQVTEEMETACQQHWHGWYDRPLQIAKEKGIECQTQQQIVGIIYGLVETYYR